MQKNILLLYVRLPIPAPSENALRAGPEEDEALREEEINRLKRKMRALTMDLDILREAARLRPTTPETSDD